VKGGWGGVGGGVCGGWGGGGGGGGEAGDRWRMVGGQKEMGGRGVKGNGEGRKEGGRKVKRKVMNNVRRAGAIYILFSTHYYNSCAHCTSPPHSLVPRPHTKWGLGTRLPTSVTTQ